MGEHPDANTCFVCWRKRDARRIKQVLQSLER